jgi:hypothetical protein
MAQGTSFKGIRWVAFGIIDPTTGLIVADEKKGLSKDGVVLVDGEGQGATTANITGLEEAGQQQYANDKVKRITHGTPTPQVALTMLDMPFDIGAKTKGYVSDGKGGWVLTAGRKPNVALMICSSDYWGNAVLDCFANGEMVEPSHNHATSNKNEADYNSTYTYQSLSPIKNDVFMDPTTGVQQSYKEYTAGDPNFDVAAMLAEVFGGFQDSGNKIINRIKGAGTTASAVSGTTASAVSAPNDIVVDQGSHSGTIHAN